MDSIYEKIIEGQRLYLKHPRLSEMKYVQAIWQDEDTMRAVGGPVQLSDERAVQWHERKVDPGSSSDRYFLIFNKKDENVGEVSFHSYDAVTKTARFNIKVINSFRGKGYASEAMKLILGYYFVEFGGETMQDDIDKSNLKGQSTLLRFGFQHVPEIEDVFLVKMTKERFFQLYR